jgi:3',5'-cyclic AMP phosphodiesterase CpdA
MRIAHFSDLHLLSLAGMGPTRFLNKRLTGYANLRLKRGSIHRSAYVRAIAKEIMRQGVDHVVITGDLTNLALEAEFELAREVVRDDLGLDASRVSVVPGNHDVYTSGSEKKLRFANYFADYIASDLPLLAVSVPAGRFPFVKLRGPVAIIGLSSAITRPPFVAAGHLGRSQLHALTRILDDDEVRKRTPIIAIHHPIHNPPSRLKAALEGLSDAAELNEILQRVPRGLVLHGHLHRRVQRELLTTGGSLASVGATSASLHHADQARSAGFNLYEIDDTGTVTHIDAQVFDPERGTFRVQTIPVRQGDVYAHA